MLLTLLLTFAAAPTFASPLPVTSSRTDESAAQIQPRGFGDIYGSSSSSYGSQQGTGGNMYSSNPIAIPGAGYRQGSGYGSTLNSYAAAAAGHPNSYATGYGSTPNSDPPSTFLSNLNSNLQGSSNNNNNGPGSYGGNSTKIQFGSFGDGLDDIGPGSYGSGSNSNNAGSSPNSYRSGSNPNSNIASSNLSGNPSGRYRNNLRPGRYASNGPNAPSNPRSRGGVNTTTPPGTVLGIPVVHIPVPVPVAVPITRYGSSSNSLNGTNPIPIPVPRMMRYNPSSNSLNTYKPPMRNYSSSYPGYNRVGPSLVNSNSVNNFQRLNVNNGPAKPIANANKEGKGTSTTSSSMSAGTPPPEFPPHPLISMSKFSLGSETAMAPSDVQAVLSEAQSLISKNNMRKNVLESIGPNSIIFGDDLESGSAMLQAYIGAKPPGDLIWADINFALTAIKHFYKVTKSTEAYVFRANIATGQQFASFLVKPGYISKPRRPPPRLQSEFY